MQKTKAAIAGILALFAVASASAQQFPVVPDRSVIGRIGVGGQSGPSQAIPFATLKSQLVSSTAINVKDKGAVGNGTTDDTAAFQTAATAACGTVGIGGAAQALYIPSGFYKITANVTIPCGLKVYGDGWSADSGALIQNNIISSNANLSGSIIEPTSTSAGLVFTTNQAVTIRDIAVVYLSRPAASSGIAGITIQAAGAASAPAPLAWNVGSTVDHVWLYGADRNLVLVNTGSFTVSNNLFHMHATNGILVQGPNLPYAGDWEIGPGNTFDSGSITNCQHILITSGGGGRIDSNKLNTCGSVNDISPLSTVGIEWSPILNVASNSLEPIVVTGNTIEGVSQCMFFYGGNVGQNATATQIVITGNQMWCLQDIVAVATSTNAQWISGLTISGNFMTAQTQAGIATTTKNIDLDGVNNGTITGNVFNLFQGAGGDTSTAINLGTHTAGISQLANKAMANVTIPATIPLAMDGAGTGIATALGVNVGTAGAPVVNGGALGTPSSGTGTNITNIPATNLTGTIAAARMPALTGDCTTVVGAVAVTCTQSAADYKVTGLLQTGGDSRVSTQFDKTSNTTPGDIPGLTATLTAGLTYGFDAILYTAANSASGVKADIAGTVTATAFTCTTSIVASAGFVGYGRTTSLATVTTGATAATDATIHLNGTITVNAGGTLTAQFAQNVSGGVASSVLVGSTMRVWKIN